jgi:hypothetical protein
VRFLLILVTVILATIAGWLIQPLVGEVAQLVGDLLS